MQLENLMSYRPQIWLVIASTRKVRRFGNIFSEIILMAASCYLCALLTEMIGHSQHSDIWLKCWLLQKIEITCTAWIFGLSPETPSCNDTVIWGTWVVPSCLPVITLPGVAKDARENTREYAIKYDTVRCRYNAVNFVTNMHDRHLIARSLGRGMGRLLWIQHLLDIMFR